MARVFVTGGVHGDEPSGALALQSLRKAGLACFGPCNPWGLVHGTRALENGRDLNRSFARLDCPEAATVRDAVCAAQPRLLVDLHEDCRAALPYFIQFGEGDIGLRLVAVLRQYEFEPRPGYFVLRGNQGVLQPGRIARGLVGLSRRWPLAYWFWRSFARAGLVVEAPAAWPLERRVAFHREVVEMATSLE
ncbi:MAG: succinylglutamate desuccinylase/aspartoacylase family protein [Planctomycetes bacterium]|nr:succinylglutamate desuccinylase/aspartoacylase family protein [Planctomycetota bacterium]